MTLFSKMSTQDLQVGLIQIRGTLTFSLSMGTTSISIPLGLSFSMLQRLRQVSRTDLSDRCEFDLEIGRLLYKITIFLQTGTTSCLIMTSHSTGSPDTLLAMLLGSTKVPIGIPGNSLNRLL
ncbi:nonstructural protein [Kowanyama virus]|uniref:Non-structural protein NS-S n=1 Tax=Kowanyama virus TaxID=1819306 RepID=A0A142J8F5_9VIRU|nr:nonstructural protein [Kowanyama virus]AMR73394.1 nonstructural protein [Kowanyama virus]